MTPENSTLVIIDMQGRLMPVIEDHENILKQCLRIANIARILGIPIIGTEQSPQSSGNINVGMSINIITKITVTTEIMVKAVAFRLVKFI